MPFWTQNKFYIQFFYEVAKIVHDQVLVCGIEEHFNFRAETELDFFFMYSFFSSNIFFFFLLLPIFEPENQSF
jgi:hypothetical protein